MQTKITYICCLLPKCRVQLGAHEEPSNPFLIKQTRLISGSSSAQDKEHQKKWFSSLNSKVPVSYTGRNYFNLRGFQSTSYTCSCSYTLGRPKLRTKSATGGILGLNPPFLIMICSHMAAPMTQVSLKVTALIVSAK